MLIFYSRSKEKAEKLTTFCKENNLELITQSLISFEAVPFELPDEPFDVVFFTSPRSVDFFIKRSDLHSDTLIACIGSSTEKHLNSLGFKASFVGENSVEPEQVAIDFQNWLDSKKVLFPISDLSNRSISKVLNRAQFVEIIVYKTIEIGRKIEPAPDVLIFSSPSNARAFLNENTINKSQKVCSFGRTTYNYLTSQHIPSQILEDPSEEAVIAFLITLKA